MRWTCLQNVAESLSHPTAARLSGSSSNVEHLHRCRRRPRRSLVMLDTWLDPSVGENG
jgi:hypothetical protein